MTYGVPKDVLRKIGAGAITELDIVEPSYASLLAERNDVAFQVDDEAEPPYRHVVHATGTERMEVDVVKKIPLTIPHPDGIVYRITLASGPIVVGTHV